MNSTKGQVASHGVEDAMKGIPDKGLADMKVLFQQLLSLAQIHVNLRIVFQYELLVISPALFHDDRTMRKTNKVNLAQKF